MNEQLINSLNNELAIELPEKIAMAEIEATLAMHINQLIQHNFQQLVQLLYRVDVNEKRLKTLLQENPGEDAGKLIARLIIDRQLQKIKTRSSFRSARDIPDDEKW